VTVMTTHDAVGVSSLLRDISVGTEAPSSLRAAARYWSAAVVSQRLARGDLQALIHLLRELSGHRRVRPADREAASAWAARLSS
jgi:hypothetical protein